MAEQRVDKAIHQARFLEVFINTASVKVAAKAAGITRNAHYQWLDYDEDYVKAYAKAKTKSMGVLLDEAIRRGVDGVVEPVYHKGRVVGRVRKYSDTCLMGVLKAKDPDFRDSLNVSGEIGIKRLLGIDEGEV
jgi:hypothetical protein